MVTLHWYPPPRDAKVFPTQHKFTHVNWYSRPWLATGVGEVYGKRDTFNSAVTPPGPSGQHFYGLLSDFQNGCRFDPGVNTIRSDWGVAVDCAEAEASGFLLQEGSNLPLLLQENGAGILIEGM